MVLAAQAAARVVIVVVVATAVAEEAMVALVAATAPSAEAFLRRDVLLAAQAAPLAKAARWATAPVSAIQRAATADL